MRIYKLAFKALFFIGINCSGQLIFKDTLGYKEKTSEPILGAHYFAKMSQDSIVFFKDYPDFFVNGRFEFYQDGLVFITTLVQGGCGSSKGQWAGKYKTTKKHFKIKITVPNDHPLISGTWKIIDMDLPSRFLLIKVK